MSENAIKLEEERLAEIGSAQEYPYVHERHRIFPAIFEDRGHRRIIDLASGFSLVARNIRDGYQAEIVCNDISPKCLGIIRELGLPSTSFNLDDPDTPFPVPDGSFDAVIALATIEHLVNTGHFLREAGRILADGGRFYLSAPNYSGITYLLPFLLSGRTFHDPLSSSSNERYEFYAHIRYFTFRTLVEVAEEQGFSLDTVYLPLPRQSSRFTSLRERSPARAFLLRSFLHGFYLLSPRWAAEPVLCLRKGKAPGPARTRIL